MNDSDKDRLAYLEYWLTFMENGHKRFHVNGMMCSYEYDALKGEFLALKRKLAKRGACK